MVHHAKFQLPVTNSLDDQVHPARLQAELEVASTKADTFND